MNVSELERHYLNVSVEAVFLDNLRSRVAGFIPAVKDALRSGIDQLEGLRKSGHSTNGGLDKLFASEKKLEDVVFLAYAVKPIVVPEDFQGNLLEYSSELLAHSDILFMFTNNILKRYTKTLAVMISSKSELNRSFSKQAFKEEITERKTTAETALQKYFPKATGKTRVPMKVVFRNKAEIQQFLDCVRKQEGINKKLDLLTMKADIEKAGLYLNNIYNLVNDKDEIVSNELLLDLADEAYDIAKLVEYAATVYFDANILSGVALKLLETIDKDF
jgi:hypothetical protein